MREIRQQLAALEFMVLFKFKAVGAEYADPGVERSEYADSSVEGQSPRRAMA